MLRQDVTTTTTDTATVSLTSALRALDRSPTAYLHEHAAAVTAATYAWLF